MEVKNTYDVLYKGVIVKTMMIILWIQGGKKGCCCNSLTNCKPLNIHADSQNHF